jgi:hypothetical protein
MLAFEAPPQREVVEPFAHDVILSAIASDEPHVVGVINSVGMAPKNLVEHGGHLLPRQCVIDAMRTPLKATDDGRARAAGHGCSSRGVADEQSGDGQWGNEPYDTPTTVL